MKYLVLILSTIFLLVVFLFHTENYQLIKKERKFIQGLKNSIEFSDPLLNDILNDFIRIANKKLDNQDVSIKLVNFPFIFDWKKQMYAEESDVSLINDYIGYAEGMFDDTKVQIYLDHDSWNKLNITQKKHLLYHELLHDVFNLDHSEIGCDLMSKQICNLKNDIDLELLKILKENEIF